MSGRHSMKFYVLTVLAIITIGGFSWFVIASLNITSSTQEKKFRTQVSSAFVTVELRNVQQGKTEGSIEQLQIYGANLTGTWKIQNKLITLYNVSDGTFCIDEVTSKEALTDYKVHKNCK